MLKNKLLRTLKQYKSQFITITIMIALGLGSFLGFYMEWTSLEDNLGRFNRETNKADFYLFSGRGFSEEEKNVLLQTEGIDQVERSNQAWVKVNNSESDELCLTLIEDNTVSSFLVVKDGIPFDSRSEKGVWLSDKYAEKNSISIGDEISISYNKRTFSGIVAGLVKSPEQLILLRDSAQMMPNYENYGFAFISPAMFKENAKFSPFYTTAKIKSSLEKSVISDKISKALGRNIEIISKSDTFSYGASQAEINKGKILCNLLPLIFLSIAVLTTLGTMFRIALREKTQIGTLLALGFKRNRIKNHYMTLILIPSVFGTILSLGVGFLIAKIIMSPHGTMGCYLDMPYWRIFFSPPCLVMAIAVPAVLSATGRLAINRVTSIPIAQALKPGDIVLNSKIGLPHFLSFSAKWNIRDMARHKARTLMSFFGVVSSMLILVVAFGLNDSVKAYMDKNINQTNTFKSRISLEENVSKRDLKRLEEVYPLYSAAINVGVSDSSVVLNIISSNNNLLKFVDQKGELLDIAPRGAFVCMRLAEKLGLKVGDCVKIRPFDTEKSFSLEIAGIISSPEKCFAISSDYADELKIDYRPDTFYSSENPETIVKTGAIRDIYGKDKLINSFSTYMNLIYLMVAVLMVVSTVLGFCVLFNMETMSFEERKTETLTLKVLGFKNKKIGAILIQQDIWIAVAGVAVGYPLGIKILDYLIKKLSAEYELLISITPFSVIISCLITLGVSIFVALRILRKIELINLAEELKYSE